jgi:hypothetical protein
VLQVVINSNSDWSKYIDIHGTGWHYDSTGHKEERVEGDTDWDSPHGQQWGMLLVPEEFANQAVARFPNECEIISETKAEAFYDEKVTRDIPAEKIDTDALAAIKAKEDLGIDVAAEKAKALDPDDPTPGIIKNDRKKFKDFKSKVGVTIKSQ